MWRIDMNKKERGKRNRRKIITKAVIKIIVGVLLIQLMPIIMLISIINDNFCATEENTYSVSGFVDDAWVRKLGGVKHSIVIYKQLAAVNIYRKNSGLFVWESDNGCARIEKDFLRIVPGIDLFKINHELYIMDLAIVERFFNLYDVIKASAKKQINIIKGSGLVENIDDISTELSNISFARKLSKISEHSPVLGKIENKKIIEFAKAHPALKNIIKYSADGTKIKLTSKKSKYLFLKLLNDDYLTSNLTNQYYDSVAKDKVNVEQE
jgi:hypothetical protein